MIGVREDLANDFPRLTKLHFFFVNQDSLQFGHCDGRMSVIELNGDIVRQRCHGQIELLESSDNVLERGGTPEVLLLQSELFTLVGVVIGIQHSSDGLSRLRCSDGLLVVSGVERLYRLGGYT